ncbi:MAG: sulfotransferase domain-containing protein [Alphaproteobacteria bacterium]|nr:sulfotransferase domain-containing protein [Alphaproteobacteria bacterium]
MANLAAGSPADINGLGAHFGLASSRDDFEAATLLDSGLLSHDDIDGLRSPVYEHRKRERPEESASSRSCARKLCGWSGRVMSWLDQADIPDHLVPYGNLKSGPVTYFTRALAFAGRQASTAIEQAVRDANFSQLRRREREVGFAERQPGAAPFFRSGRVGAWREILNPEQRTRIEDAHAAVMDRLGYAPG